MATPLTGIPEILANQNNKYLVHNEAIRDLEALAIGAIENATTSTPPASPDEGDMYIVAATGTGAWSGLDNELVQYQDGSWVTFTLFDGFTIFNKDTNTRFRFNGSTWSEITTAGSGDMTKSTYDTDNDGVVDSAEKVEGVDAAGNSTYYGKNAGGTAGFHSLPVNPADMEKADYDSNDDGVVDAADEVDGISAAGNDKYYGTNDSGTAGFYDLPSYSLEIEEDGSSVETDTVNINFTGDVSVSTVSGDVTVDVGRTYTTKTITLPYTLIASDLHKELIVSSGTGILEIPDSISGFADYWNCMVSLDGSGDITIQREDTTDTNLLFSGGNTNNHLKTQGTIVIRHRTSNVWKIEGGLEA